MFVQSKTELHRLEHHQFTWNGYPHWTGIETIRNVQNCRHPWRSKAVTEKICYNSVPATSIIPAAQLEVKRARHAGIGFEQDDVDKLRARLKQMSDEDLRRVGKAGRFVCRLGPNGEPPRECLVIQLNEAKAAFDG